MNVLIIDDEKHVREGIKLLADWESVNIHSIIEAENGKIAQDMIKKFRPEIIFTDMKMPELDGRELLKWISEEGLSSKVIVITGYDDYEYMREAIKYGASDYLLKPIDPETLNSTLLKGVNQWKKEELKRVESYKELRIVNELRPFYRDQHLTNALLKEQFDQTMLKEFGYNDEQKMKVILLKLLNLESFKEIWPEEICYFSILNIANEYLHTNQSGVAFRNLQKSHEICLFYWGKDEKDTMEELMKQFYSIVPFPIHVAIGERIERLNDVSFGYLQAIKIVNEMNVLSNNRTPLFTAIDIKEYQPINLVELIRVLDISMEKQDILIYDDLVRSIRQHVLQQNYLSLSQVITLNREFSMFVERWKEKLTIQIEETINLDFYWDANGHLMIQKLLNDQRDIMLKIIQLQSNHEKEVSSIEKIARFIQINYEEDISLQEFSERFYLSREYISRKFKQMYGENISDYIVRIRIEKAKELLKFPNLKIYEIANRIGYQDDKYFRKVFKKAVGITPSDYRKNFEEQ